MAADDLKKTTRDELESALKKASTVVAAYGSVLEQVTEPGILLHSESDLPFTKAEIRRSIELLLIVSTDDTKRNNLEVVDMLLNDFVPDEDCCVVQHQRGGLSQALKNFNAGERDAMQLAKIVGDGVTQEGEAQLRQIEERVKHDNQTTLERHRELRREAALLQRAT